MHSETNPEFSFRALCGVCGQISSGISGGITGEFLEQAQKKTFECWRYSWINFENEFLKEFLK